MKELKEELFYSPKNGYDRIKDAEKDAVMKMGEDYIKFLNNARTERAATSYAALLAEQNGFVPYTEGMTLEPGDVVTTGTPAGIGAMQPGDVVEVEIDGVGTLKNTVV